jgi:Rrf2 family protein
MTALRFNTQTRYGMRAMICIARRHPNPTPCEKIACEQRISKKYLDRILGKLRSAGILKSVRGKLGGYELARSPEEISLFEILSVLDGYLDPVACVMSPEKCNRSAVCPARTVWCSLAESFHGTLKGISLASMAAKGTGEACCS